MDLLWLVPLAPLAGSLILLLTEGRLDKRIVGIVGAGSVGLSAVIAFVVGLEFHRSGLSSHTYEMWTWMDVGGFAPAIRLYLDALSLVMMGVITGVGFLIHLYATGYMWDEEGYSRFFAYMNLFVFAMLMLVLGDNLLVLFLGWEGVGLCSYLLIGFFHTEPENGYAARKAFVVTRVGDTAMLLGLVPAVPRVRHDRHQRCDGGRQRSLARGLIDGDADRPAATWRRCRQVGAGAAADLAAGRHGRSDAGVRADSRGDDGDRWRIPHRTHARTLPAIAGGATGCRLRWTGHVVHLVFHGADAARHQARARLLDHEPDRLHVPGARRRRLVGSHFPPDDPCIFQGAPVPCIRIGHPGAAP